MWEDVVGIHKEAAESEELGQNENAWATGVILQILKKGLKRHPTLQVKNVSEDVTSFPVRSIRYFEFTIPGMIGVWIFELKTHLQA
ncbi:hypothetical protein RU639_002044 [Aspergillus parasiticus]